MKAERPALGISRSMSYPDAQVYHVDCECTDPDHAVNVWIEVSTQEDMHCEVEVTFYVQTSLAGWRRLPQRIAEAWRVLRNADSERYHSLLLNKQAALNLGGAIEASIEDLENANP